MDKRVLQAVLLSLAVLLLYQNFFAPKPTPAPAATASQSAAPASPSTPATPAAPTPDAAPIVDPSVPATPVVVESEHIRAEFTTRGGSLVGWTLKGYKASNGEPLDLFAESDKGNTPRAFTLSTGDAAVDAALANGIYSVSEPGLDLRNGGQRTLRFDYAGPDGVRATKIYAFERDGQPYLVGFSAQVLRNGQPQNFTIHSGAGLGDVERARPAGGFLFGTGYQAPEAILYGESIERHHTDSFATQRVFDGQYAYAGVDDHYFLGAALLDRQTRIEYSTVPVTTPAGDRTLVSYTLQFPQPPTEVKFYLGPKDFDQLLGSSQSLVRTINFGIFAWLVVPLLRALKFINQYVGNYGWSIITLTILINIVLFPLRHKSVVSMRKMQEIQPRVKAIQDRYSHLKATDPARQKMNQELMDLYRTAGVNPASGCVPMLLTMPVLFAFYALLSVAIELRGAPFALWITDLSQHDPLYITPFIMGATMLWQQWITPAAGVDPAQQRIMLIMPVMFTVFSLWFPSGLVLYWMFSNLLTIGQQYLTNRIVGTPRPGGAKPARA